MFCLADEEVGMSKNWVVQRIEPGAHYQSSTVTIGEWRKSELLHSGKTDAQIRGEFEDVAICLGNDSRWTHDLRREPRVAYDIAHNGYYFIFESSKNNYIFVVSDGGLVDQSVNV
jgi:hypothetical protein